MARSLADRCRQHREEMTVALQMHCTPAEARAELDRRAARLRWQMAERRLAAKAVGMAAPLPAGQSDHDRRFWWKED